MQKVESIADLKRIVTEARSSGKTIGFVPTMGYLHEGHLSLVRASLSRGDWTVVSIFVNPLQFGPEEDFDRYPRDLERDAKLLDEEGAHLLFAPSVNEMYPGGVQHPHTIVHVPEVQDKLCGRSRPGHFDGVATVVTKLFHMVEPDRVYFGQKDYQQTLVVERLLRDLAMTPQLVRVPTVREEDGLALSSRNTYLNEEQRAAAPLLWRLLNESKQRILAGETNADRLRSWLADEIAAEPLARLDYVDIVDPKTLESLHHIDDRALIALAVFFGKTRLIDNLLIER